MLNNELEKISGDLVGYIHPEYFLEEFKDKILPGSKFSKELAEKYYTILMSISYFLKKLSKYEIYFLEFYPNTENISYYDALEHHIHAYLEDVETLKNKLNHYLGCLKNDIKKVATNKKEVSEALEFLTGQVFKTFEKVSTLRASHRHKGSIFVDTNIINGQVAEYMLSDKNLLKDRLTPYAFDHFAKEKSESFEKAKIFWVKNVKKNLPQVNGITNDILHRTKSFLYILLDIKPINFNKNYK